MDKKLSSPLSTLQWVDRSRVKPNDYNPNKVSKQNLELLKQSILTNGWTLPIVVDQISRLLMAFIVGLLQGKNL